MKSDEVLLSDLPPGTLFVDEDGDLCLRLTGKACVIIEFKPRPPAENEEFGVFQHKDGERARKVLKNAVLYTNEDKI
jgi:hypothetical protein